MSTRQPIYGAKSVNELFSINSTHYAELGKHCSVSQIGAVTLTMQRTNSLSILGWLNAFRNTSTLSLIPFNGTLHWLGTSIVNKMQQTLHMNWSMEEAVNAMRINLRWYKECFHIVSA